MLKPKYTLKAKTMLNVEDDNNDDDVDVVVELTAYR